MDNLEYLQKYIDSHSSTIRNHTRCLLKDLSKLREPVKKLVELQKKLDEEKHNLEKDRDVLSQVLADPGSNIVASQPRQSEYPEAVDPATVATITPQSGPSQLATTTMPQIGPSQPVATISPQIGPSQPEGPVLADPGSNIVASQPRQSEYPEAVDPATVATITPQSGPSQLATTTMPQIGPSQPEGPVDPTIVPMGPSQPQPQPTEPQPQFVLSAEEQQRVDEYMAQMKTALRTLIQNQSSWFLHKFIPTKYLPSAVDKFIDFVIDHNKLDTDHFPELALYTEHPKYVQQIREAVPYFVKAIRDQTIRLIENEDQ